MARKGGDPGLWSRFLDRVSQSFRSADNSKSPTPQQQPAPAPQVARAAVAEPPNQLQAAVAASKRENAPVRGIEPMPDGTTVSPSPATAPAAPTVQQRGRSRSLSPEHMPSSPPRSPTPSSPRSPDTTPSPAAENSAAKHPEMTEPKEILQAAEKVERQFDTSANKAQSIEERYTQNQDKAHQPNREQHHDKENDHDR